ncbi:hypothetical protein FWF89_03715 [Candidatus Saccharibacteria bacterium]|nr:hypothetical protein [Candidatus Saccharibacteria bacterium]
MFITVLGRQPKISLAELESVYGASNITPLSDQLALINTKTLELNHLGGTIKAGQIIIESLLDHLSNLPPGKITLGFSDYSPKATAKSAQMQALKLKSVLKRHGRSVRIVPNNSSAALSSAASHHNQLGEKTNHIEIISYQKYTALSIGTQNITAYAKRDQARPARDAFVGMLPPKLAQILINLATGPETSGHLLDPFCGTGTILQEALLMGFSVYGTDLSEKMISYSKKNLDWLAFKLARTTLSRNFCRHDGSEATHPATAGVRSVSEKELSCELEAGDATNFKWKQPIDFIVSETYLGQPFSAPPSDIKLKEVQFTTKSIILAFLKNIHPQLKPGTPLALAIPAWRRPDQTFSHLNIVDEIKKLGYNVHQFKHATSAQLLYYRESQVVARQIIVLRKI